MCSALCAFPETPEDTGPLGTGPQQSGQRPRCRLLQGERPPSSPFLCSRQQGPAWAPLPPFSPRQAPLRAAGDGTPAHSTQPGRSSGATEGGHVPGSLPQATDSSTEAAPSLDGTEGLPDWPGAAHTRLWLRPGCAFVWAGSRQSREPKPPNLYRLCRRTSRCPAAAQRGAPGRQEEAQPSLPVEQSRARAQALPAVPQTPMPGDSATGPPVCAQKSSKALHALSRHQSSLQAPDRSQPRREPPGRDCSPAGRVALACLPPRTVLGTARRKATPGAPRSSRRESSCSVAAVQRLGNREAQPPPAGTPPHPCSEEQVAMELMTNN